MKQLGHNSTQTDTRVKGFNCVWQEQGRCQAQRGGMDGPRADLKPHPQGTCAWVSATLERLKPLREQPGRAGRGMEAAALPGLTKG